MTKQSLSRALIKKNVITKIINITCKCEASIIQALGQADILFIFKIDDSAKSIL